MQSKIVLPVVTVTDNNEIAMVVQYLLNDFLAPRF